MLNYVFWFVREITSRKNYLGFPRFNVKSGAKFSVSIKPPKDTARYIRIAEISDFLVYNADFGPFFDIFSV